ncbi:DUF3301 domain-containing protein [Pseudaeromonas sharmana]|uniref:DUF3301 domain-containing protein n=1 Tax=Pseudaeromonas sharmana TaxID=328412 RepID=A0ABV8CRX4_9GAMM
MTVELCLALIASVMAEFWLRRRQSELAIRLINQYCERQHWQLLTVARHTDELLPLVLRLLFKRPSSFLFEFSVDQEQSLSGELLLQGLHSPLFRIANNPAAADTVEPQPGNNVIPFPQHRPHDRK